ncbi:carbohydrate ABC transporter membrane protein 2, CUT1 family [Streptosporangium subroseum]|uniref:Carbohydrate ABC transporter membrane protein 2, CUT1 family n=1 Tax=Streptosporangium subroseum TaxID=106412 RepID=A0A239JFY4_9ACTN|nr:carbohydrate ABC transporter permease [Streptosporangium subroseum]SNT03634.1 carbohydrate ABC transporter membrane protein 2, CUT1 family [Streptosporangium subroseum]
MTAINDVLRSRARLVIAGVVTLLFVAPIYLTIVNAFKAQSQILESPEALPIPPTIDNLSTALARPDGLIQLGLQNSLIDVVFSVALLIPLASAFSFYISRRKTKARAAVLALLAAGLMIPPQVILLPTIQILTFFGLDHSYPGLILSNLGGGYLSFAVFVYVGFMRAVPNEIIEAARLDGASGLRIWWGIVMPLVRPATATVAIFSSLWIWNDFLNPLFILGPLQGQTITTGLYLTIGQYSVDYGQLFGIMFLAAIVPVVGYLFVQKQFIAGLTSGSSK